MVDSPSVVEVTSFQSGQLSLPQMRSFFRKNQYLHIRNVVAQGGKKNAAAAPGVVGRSEGGTTQREDGFSVDTLRDLHTRAPEMVARTFSLENSAAAAKSAEAESSSAGAGKKSKRKTTEGDEDGPDGPRKRILGAVAGTGLPGGSWYVSFIAQRGRGGPDGEAWEWLRERLPVEALVDLATSSSQEDGDPSVTQRDGHRTTSPIWCFLGHAESPLDGRVEHLDSVSHDGTWHYQARGTKDWFIRPSASTEWGDGGQPQLPEGKERLHIVVEEGDVFAINTRLWWHATRLDGAGSAYSLSYARDFFDPSFSLRAPGAEGDKAEDSGAQSDSSASDYTNIDGVYATRDVTEGEVVLTEHDMPDCALPRSADPNCEIVEVDDGVMALMANRSISTGDWLTVAESSSDESGSWDSDSEDSDASSGPDKGGQTAKRRKLE
jgi:hypothetical protein